MIDQETKDKWIAALRSGEYKQGNSRLRYDDELGSSFCCLGVLCEVMGKEVHRSRLGTEGYLFSWSGGGVRKCTAELPSVIIGLDVQRKLMAQNDDLYWSFSKIADWIEENINP